MRIFIEPTEPLLFRTGRPFIAGENTAAESIFPPTPQTLQGALRALIAIQWGQAQKPPVRHPGSIFEKEELVKLIGKRTGEGDNYGQFRITGITLGKRDLATDKIERLFPAPAHIMKVTLKDESGKKSKPLVLLQPGEKAACITNIPDDHKLLFPKLQGHKTTEKAQPLTGWLTSKGLKAVLAGDLPSESKEQILKPDTIYTQESRLGIGMQNESKTTKEGYLYTVQMVRMHPGYGFVIDIALGENNDASAEKSPYKEEQLRDAYNDMAFMTTGWMTIGGEQRAAHFTVLAPEESRAEEGISQTKSGNLLYFATPAYFKKGWLPDDSTIFTEKPLTAALNRYQPIGGWYLDPKNAGGGSKTMRRCIPAGSVYFFEKEIKVERPMTEYGWQIGYGITYTGDWKK